MSPFIQAVINGCCRCASERPDWRALPPGGHHTAGKTCLYSHAHKKWVKGGEKGKMRKRKKIKKKGEG